MVGNSNFVALVALLGLTASALASQIDATTEDGRKVILRPDGTWAYLEESAEAGPKVDEPTIGNPGYARLTKAEAIWEEPEVTAQLLSYHEEGMIFETTGWKKGKWIQVHISGRFGYIPETSLEFVNLGERPPALGSPVWVSVEKANIRREPSTSSPIVSQVGFARKLFSQSKRGAWVQVVWNDPSDSTGLEYSEGWIHDSLVSETEKAQPIRRKNEPSEEIGKIEAFFQQVKREVPSRIAKICKNHRNRAECEVEQRLYAEAILHAVPGIARQARLGNRTRPGAGRATDPIKELGVYRDCEDTDFAKWGGMYRSG